MTTRYFRIVVALIALLFSCALSLAGGKEIENKLNAEFEAGNLSGLHSVYVVQNNENIAEVYFEGIDERWGAPLGRRQHNNQTLHDLRSVTKSIVGLLYGIALSEGIVPGPGECLVCQFPQYKDLEAEPERKNIQVHHALTMQMGTDWNENIPYSNIKNSEIAMELSEDKYRYVLDRPLVDTPGAAWVYNGGATTIIGKLIGDGSGMALEDYARTKLFEPLGITKFDWVKGFGEKVSAASGLRLTAPDLAKIGRMVLDNGKFNGQQIVPKDWLTASFTPHATTSYVLRYGYFWWLAAENAPQWIAGFGNGGQRLTLSKDANTVIVIFAGNYNKSDAWELPAKVIEEIIAPELYR